MKRVDPRPVRPLESYQEHQHYPAVACEDGEDPAELEEVSRREFFGRAAVSAAAVSAAAAGAAGVGLTAQTPTAQAAPKDGDGRHKVTLNLGRLRLGHSTMSVRQVVVWTADKKLASWLRKYSNRPGVTGAFKPVLRKTTEKVLVDGKKIYRLERKLGAALVRHYQRKTGRRVSQPDLMIILGRYWRPRMRGVIVRPTFRPRPHP